MWNEQESHTGSMLPTLTCDFPGCKAAILGVKQPEILARARAGNWGIWEGPTIGGKLIYVHVCPAHTGRKREPRRMGAMPGDVPLF